MSNLIPMAPNSRDIQEMARLKAIMEGRNVPAIQEPIQAQYTGGHRGSRLNESRQAPPPPPFIPQYGPGREDVDAMKNILHKLSALGGEEFQAPQPRQSLVESAPMSYLADSQAPQTANGPFTVLVQIVESNGKEVNRYSVVDNARRDVFADLVVKESASAIMKLMNRGEGVSSPKVKEVLSLDEEFTRNRGEMTRHKSRYTRSSELGETAAANVFKDRFNTAKANAMVAQDTIKSILESIR